LPDFRVDEAWLRYYREDLSRRYGPGTVVAVYDGAVIDWGDDIEHVRSRAEVAFGEPVFVGQIPSDPVPDFREDWDAYHAEYERYEESMRGCKYRRRFEFDLKTLEASDELDITGTKREMADGYIQIDGTERRFAEHDYRLLVEHGAIPRETELIAGVVFWKEPRNRQYVDED
jgi:hypothetical protein